MTPAAEPEPESTLVSHRAGSERLSAGSGQLREAREAGVLRSGEVVLKDHADLREAVDFGDTVRLSAAENASRIAKIEEDMIANADLLARLAAENASGASGYASDLARARIANAALLARVPGQDVRALARAITVEAEPFGTPGLGSGALLGCAAGAIADGGFRPPELASICGPDVTKTSEAALVLEDQVDQREAVGNSNAACGVLEGNDDGPQRESGVAAVAVTLEDHVELRETVSVVSPAEEVLCASSGVTTETRVPDGAETFTLPAAPELQWLDEVHAIRILAFF